MAHNTPVVLAIFTFYTCIFVVLGFLGSNVEVCKALTGSQRCSEQFQLSLGPTHVEANWFTSVIVAVWDFVGFFVNGVGVMILGLPIWANTLLFLPLGTTILYIITVVARGGD